VHQETTHEDDQEEDGYKTQDIVWKHCVHHVADPLTVDDIDLT